MKRGRSTFAGDVPTNEADFFTAFGTAKPPAKVPALYNTTTSHAAPMFVSRFPFAAAVPKFAAESHAQDSSVSRSVRVDGGVPVPTTPYASALFGGPAIGADAWSGDDSMGRTRLPEPHIDEHDMLLLRRLLQPLVPSVGGSVTGATPAAAGLYPMHTWAISSRLSLSAQPRLYVLVIDCSTYFAVHLAEFALSATPTHTVAALVGFSGSSRSLPETIESAAHVEAAVECVKEEIDLAYTAALTSALEKIATFAKSISTVSNMPTQPQHVVKDGSEPLAVPGFWLGFVEQYMSALTGDGTPPGPTPTLQRLVSTGMGIPFHQLRIESPKPADGLGAGRIDEAFDAGHGPGQLISQRLLDQYVAHWNVRAEQPMYTTTATGAGTSSSCPRLRLLSFFQKS